MEKKNESFLSYRELGVILPKYLQKLNYTHAEIMPLMEHPLDNSWGYQCTGLYSPTSRYGSLNDLKFLIDELHKHNIGVIFDWVPGHFCKDIHGLARFDGSPTYEYDEEWKADNKVWGTLNFNLGKPEVRSFLISNAFYWIKEFHLDGIRVDAVSNMLYFNYESDSNPCANNCAVDFLKTLNTALLNKFPYIVLAAEESTTWPKVSFKVDDGGLGFNFKWNMGWMNDCLKYIEIDPIFRKYNHEKLTFSMLYNYDEHFILPISHDEVVHGKLSFLNKMWGDYWNKFAGARLFMTYMIGHPGKKLTFMGSEIGQFIEWSEDKEIEWELAKSYDMHKKMQLFVQHINRVYKEEKSLWELDYNPEGFKWIEPDNKEQSVFIFMRKGNNPQKDTLIFICNFTPVYYEEYLIGVPYLTNYREILNSDNSKYGGSGQTNDNVITAIDKKYHNQRYCINIKVPPMGAVILGIDNK